MANIVGKVIRDIANLSDHAQIEVFRTIASFPAITLTVLEMTSIEIADVVESSHTLSLGGPSTLKPSRTRSTQRRLLPEGESGEEDDGVEELAKEQLQTKQHKARSQTLCLIISYNFLVCNLECQIVGLHELFKVHEFFEVHIE